MITDTKNAEAKALFDEHIKGKNIMTPYLLGYGVAGSFAYELTEGKDMDGRPLYGVTVLERGSGYRRNDLSTCFSGMDSVKDHLKTLKEATRIDGSKKC